MPLTHFHIIQSNDINTLFSYLLKDYNAKSTQIFAPFVVIVPSKVMGEWLKKQVADQAGISTLVTAEFWGSYQWTLMQQVLQEYAKHRPREALRVPEVAVLSKNVMQWRLFGYFNAEKQAILTDANHPLYPLLEPLVSLPVTTLSTQALTQPAGQSSLEMFTFLPLQKDHGDIPKWLRKKSFLDKNRPQLGHFSAQPKQDFQTASHDQRLWQLASDMASMLNRYMTYRPEWLNLWAKNLNVNVRQMIAKKDELNLYMAGIKLNKGRDNDEQAGEQERPATSTSPDWLIEHYEQLEIAQRYLWQVLFNETYQYREAISTQFWQALTHKDPHIARACRQALPEQLTLFTIQQLPKTELAMMAKLAKFTNIKLLHYNPSQMFWADIVDKNWLAQQTHINPEAIYFKDYGHTLLSRFGKQSREVFAMLADFSGNDSETLGDVLWEDDFIPVIPSQLSSHEKAKNHQTPPTLLAHLQQDILMLQERQRDHSTQLLDDLVKQLDERYYRPAREWQLNQIDNSLSIHACHSMVRQLEILRSMVIGWLNYTDKPYLLNGLTKADTDNLAEKSTVLNNANPIKTPKKSAKKQKNSHQLSLLDAIFEEKISQDLDTLNHSKHQLTRANRRSLSDILVLLPDIEAQQAVIESIFPKGIGTDGYELPAKVTGVTSKDINQLWSAITGFFTLLQSSHTGAGSTNLSATGQASGQSVARFDRSTVFDWLMLSPLLESYGLSPEQMTRGCELLALAGFARGFDETHLANTLHEQDDDYRYSFAYALERLVAGLLMPNAQTTQFGNYINRYNVPEKILPVAQVQLGDSAVIAVLCDIYSTIDRLRDIGGKMATAKNWLKAIERFIHEKFQHFEQTNALNSIWAALNSFEKNIQANQRYAKSHLQSDTDTNATAIDPDKLPLKLGFILASIESELASQQVSAEPSGVITFGRIGAVRNLPYKLVVMLNLNLSNFPNQDNANRYDLMQAGIGERGDRFKEDDELGAFLDAILSAKEACWLFYNGASTSDTHEHLPASPVQELLSFLQGEVAWQLTSDAKTPSEFVKKNTAKLIQAWLVTRHPELPFEPNYFDTPQLKKGDSGTKATDLDTLNHQIALIKHAQKPLYPPAPLWHSVFEHVYHPVASAKNNPSQKIPIWQKTALINWLAAWDNGQRSLATLSPATHQALPVLYANLSLIVRDVQQPAKTFMNAQHIHLSHYEDDSQNIEPIELDTLAKYQINASLLAEILTPTEKLDTGLDNLVFSNELPAGVSRYISIHAQRQKISNDTLNFWEKLQTLDTTAFPAIAKVINDFTGDYNNLVKILTPCQDQRFAILIAEAAASQDIVDTTADKGQTVIITAHFPSLQTKKSDNADTIDAGYWINYLPTSGREKYQVQFWLSHLSWQVARHTTAEQVNEGNGFSLWQFSDKKTYYLPPIAYEQAYRWLQDWLGFWQLCKKQVMVLPPSVALTTLTAMQKALETQQTPDIVTALPAKWKGSGYNSDEVIYDDDPRHPYWAFLLKDKPIIATIKPFILTLGERLYLPILNQMQTLDNETDNTTNATLSESGKDDPEPPKLKKTSKDNAKK